ncbi:MAG: hypothetical protein ABI383_08870 [Acidobacteriaceae bacterium]
MRVHLHTPPLFLLTEALANYCGGMVSLEERVHAHPDRADFLRDLSVSYERMLQVVRMQTGVPIVLVEKCGSKPRPFGRVAILCRNKVAQFAAECRKLVPKERESGKLGLSGGGGSRLRTVIPANREKYRELLRFLAFKLHAIRSKLCLLSTLRISPRVFVEKITGN